MNYFLADFNNQPSQKQTEAKRWLNAAGNSALIGAVGTGALGTLGARNRYYGSRLGLVKSLAGGLAGGGYLGLKYGLLGYGGYRLGKSLVNWIRNKDK